MATFAFFFVKSILKYSVRFAFTVYTTLGVTDAVYAWDMSPTLPVSVPSVPRTLSCYNCLISC